MKNYKTNILTLKNKLCLNINELLLLLYMLLAIIFTDYGNYKCIFKSANNPKLCFTVGHS